MHIDYGKFQSNMLQNALSSDINIKIRLDNDGDTSLQLGL